MYSFEIFQPLVTLFEHMFNVFAIFGEIAVTKYSDFVNSFNIDSNNLVFNITNIWNDNIFTYKLTFGKVINETIVWPILESLGVVLKACFPYLPIDNLPTFAIILLSIIPLMILFFLVGIVIKIITK